MDIILKWAQTNQAATADGTAPNTPQEAQTTRSMKRTNNIKDHLGGTTNTPLMAMETATRNLMMTNITTPAGTVRNIRRITADLIPIIIYSFFRREMLSFRWIL